MDELHVDIMAGFHRFSKNLKTISKPMCQKSDIKEVHYLGVLAHKI